MRYSSAQTAGVSKHAWWPKKNMSDTAIKGATDPTPRSSGAGSRPLLLYGLAGAMKPTHTVEVDFKSSGSARRPFRRARRDVRFGPFNPTLLAGIEDEPNRAAHRRSKRL